MERLRAFAKTLRVPRASGVIAACVLAVACERKPDDTRLTLALAPDASCAGATSVDLVDTLEVSLLSETGAVIQTWDLPFDVHGSEASLGNLPHDGRGRFAARGTGPVCSVSAVAIFEGTSALVPFEPKNDQRVEVPVTCPVLAPCTEPTPDATPFASNQAADLVLGQPDYVTCNGGATGNGRRFREPDGLELAGDVLWVADRGFNRIAAFTPAAELSSGAQISFVLGQNNILATNNGDGTDTLDHPRGVIALSDRLVVTDGLNHRGQIVVPIPSDNGAAASFAIGQDDASNQSVNAGGSTNLDTLDTPWGGVQAGGYVFVTDSLNHRVLRIPVASLGANRPAADIVLGQADFTSNLPNRGAAAGADTLASPAHVATDGTRLWVADTGNHRVLAFNLATLSSGAPAVLVVTSGGGVNLSGPLGVAASPARLVIADSENHRVLVWEPPPSSPADQPTAVLGQADFLAITANTGGNAGGACETMDTCVDPGREPTATSLSRPGAVLLRGDELWVSDSCNARVLRYHAPTR